eukprot:365066-Chlamydomonas_euryale.AAC.11
MLHDGEQFNTCVACEAVAASVRFRNPLAVPLAVGGVHLWCEFTPGLGSADGAADATVAAGLPPSAVSQGEVAAIHTATPSAAAHDPLSAPLPPPLPPPMTSKHVSVCVCVIECGQGTRRRWKEGGTRYGVGGGGAARWVWTRCVWKCAGRLGFCTSAMAWGFNASLVTLHVTLHVTPSCDPSCDPS